MKGSPMKILLLVATATVLIAAPAPSGAAAAVGVEKVSRLGAAPGETVKLTLGCGFCYPPCEGPKGERHPKGFERGPCMLGTDAEPPVSFGVSLVPRSKAAALVSCGRRALCPPTTVAPPRRHPYSLLGYAVPPPGGNNPESGDPPRYLLRFQTPALPAGDYAYVIWCDACAKGKHGGLIASPASRLWRLGVVAKFGT
jgi:hypothetical protein